MRAQTDPTTPDARAPILLVDDRPANLLALEGLLSSPDYEIVSVASGREALAELERRDFAVTLLDVQMPTMDGFETARRMKLLADEQDRDVPIIFFVTGIDADRSHVHRAYAGGAVDFIQKPLEPEVLRARVAFFVEFYRAKERLRTRLLEAVRAREDVLAVVSHDLRDPLNIVLMSAKVIAQIPDETPSAVRAKKAAGSIIKAVERMTRLVTDLLDLARVDAGQALPLDLATADVSALAEEAAELVEPLASAGRLTLTVDSLGAAAARCDGDRVQQVLANLLGNAIKFTGEGGAISVRIRTVNGEVVVSVCDTGTGIPAHQIPHLFEPYWKADTQGKRGAGLGLSIVKASVVAQGGRVWVETTVGSGSTFHFTLPAAGAMSESEEPR